MSYNSSNSNYTRVESFGTPSAFDPNNINESQTTLQPSSETTINACVSLVGLTAASNGYSVSNLGLIPSGSIVTRVTVNSSQSLVAGVSLKLSLLQSATSPTLGALPTTATTLLPTTPLTTVPGIFGTDINASVTYTLNVRIPQSTVVGENIYLLLVTPVVPSTLAAGSLVNVTISYK